MQNHWNKKGKEQKDLVLFDSCVLLSKPLRDHDQFLSLAKQFKKFTLISFTIMAMVIYKSCHFSLLLLCNSISGPFSEETFFLQIDPLGLHNQSELQIFLTRVLKYAAQLQSNRLNSKEKNRLQEPLQFWNLPQVQLKKFKFGSKCIQHPPQTDSSACGCFPIVYADTILGMKDPTSVDEWQQLHLANKLPSQESIEDVRHQLHKEYLSLMSKGMFPCWLTMFVCSVVALLSISFSFHFKRSHKYYFNPRQTAQ